MGRIRAERDVGGSVKRLLPIVLVALFLASSALAGHKPVSCKGYLYWSILEPSGGGQSWRDVKAPVVARFDPITPSVWDLPTAAQRLLLILHAKAQQQAGSLKIRGRNWDSICWHMGEAEPVRHSWPVQP
jgi:hypothetical protein